MNQNTKPVFALKAAVVLCLGLGASTSGWADSPLGLALSETLTHDTNILRSDAQKRSDTVSSTGVKVFLDKSYGRQQYTASVMGIFDRYKDLKEYDNDGYQLDLGFTSQLAANGLISINHNRNRSLQDFGGLGLARYRETVTSESTNFSGRYGLYGRWGVTGSITHNAVEYERNIPSNQEVVGTRLGLRYSPSDLLFFDVGVKRSKSDLDNSRNNVIVNGVPVLVNGVPLVRLGDKVDRTDVNVISQWVVTGYSRLDGQLGWTREDYDANDARDYSGVTGRVAWNYTPRGKVSYTLSLSRDTNNAGGTSYLYSDDGSFAGAREGREVQKRLTTSVQGSANWQATAKVSADAGFVWRKLDEERTNDFGGSSLSGNYRSLSMGLRYVPTRSLSFDCQVSTYNRSETALSLGYSGRALTCTAGFVLD